MPRCQNCKVPKYYKGTEKSPTAFGKCGTCETIDTKTKGKDKNDWVVTKRKTGKYWKKISNKAKKVSQKLKKKRSKKRRTTPKPKKRGKRALRFLEKQTPIKLETNMNDKDISKDLIIYSLKFLDINGLLNMCQLNSDYSRFCLRNQTRILREFYNDDSITSQSIYPLWKKVEKDHDILLLEGDYVSIAISRQGSGKIIAKVIAPFNRRHQNQVTKESNKANNLLRESGLELKQGGLWYLNNTVPRFHFNILVENARKAGFD